MNFTDTTNIHFFDKIFIIKTIRTDYDYIIYRAIPTGTATGEATLIIKFSDDKETVKLKKVSQSYNAARKVYIYGVSWFKRLLSHGAPLAFGDVNHQKAKYRCKVVNTGLSLVVRTMSL